jgi:hypothetical protein
LCKIPEERDPANWHGPPKAGEPPRAAARDWRGKTWRLEEDGDGQLLRH